MKPCKQCGFPKPLSAFIRNSRTADGTAGTCKACAAVSKAKAFRAGAQPYGVAREFLAWASGKNDRVAASPLIE